MAQSRCESIQESLAGCLYRDLPSADQAGVEAHVRECASCARALEQLRLASAALHEWTLEPMQTPALTGPWTPSSTARPQAARARRSTSRMRRASRGHRAARPRSLSLTPLLAAAAALVAATVGIIVWQSKTRTAAPQTATVVQKPVEPVEPLKQQQLAGAKAGSRTIRYGEPIHAEQKPLYLTLSGGGELVLDRGGQAVLIAAGKLRLDAGRVYCHPPERSAEQATAGAASFTISTAAGSFAAFGTRFLVHQVRSDRALLVVAEGRVRASSAGKQVEVLPAQEVEVFRGHGPGKVRRSDLGLHLAFLKGENVHYAADFTYGPGGWKGRVIEGALAGITDEDNPSAIIVSSPSRGVPLCRVASETLFRFRCKAPVSGDLVYMVFNATSKKNFSRKVHLTGSAAWRTLEVRVVDLVRHPGSPPRTRPRVGDVVNQITFTFNTKSDRKATFLLDDVELFEPRGSRQ